MWRGCCQNVLEDLRKLSTAQNTAAETCDGPSSGKPNKKYAATQRYSDNQRSQAICCQLQYYRSYRKDRSCGIIKFTVKEKVNLSFDITADASKLRFFTDI